MDSPRARVGAEPRPEKSSRPKKSCKRAPVVAGQRIEVAFDINGSLHWFACTVANLTRWENRATVKFDDGATKVVLLEAGSEGCVWRCEQLAPQSTPNESSSTPTVRKRKPQRQSAEKKLKRRKDSVQQQPTEIKLAALAGAGLQRDEGAKLVSPAATITATAAPGSPRTEYGPVLKYVWSRPTKKAESSRGSGGSVLWSPEENIALATAVGTIVKSGKGSFTQVARFLGDGRSASSCRHHWALVQSQPRLLTAVAAAVADVAPSAGALVAQITTRDCVGSPANAKGVVSWCQDASECAMSANKPQLSLELAPVEKSAASSATSPFPLWSGNVSDGSDLLNPRFIGRVPPHSKRRRPASAELVQAIALARYGRRLAMEQVGYPCVRGREVLFSPMIISEGASVMLSHSEASNGPALDSHSSDNHGGKYSEQAAPRQVNGFSLEDVASTLVDYAKRVRSAPTAVIPRLPLKSKSRYKHSIFESRAAEIPRSPSQPLPTCVVRPAVSGSAEFGSWNQEQPQVVVVLNLVNKEWSPAATDWIKWSVRPTTKLMMQSISKKRCSQTEAELATIEILQSSSWKITPATRFEVVEQLILTLCKRLNGLSEDMASLPYACALFESTCIHQSDKELAVLSDPCA